MMIVVWQEGKALRETLVPELLNEEGVLDEDAQASFFSVCGPSNLRLTLLDYYVLPCVALYRSFAKRTRTLIWATSSGVKYGPARSRSI
jgi:hypothetical protein